MSQHGVPSPLKVPWWSAVVAVLAVVILALYLTRPPPVAPVVLPAIATDPAPAAAPSADDDHLGASTTITNKSSAMSREERDAWIRQCVERPTCKQWQVAAMVAGASGADYAHTKGVSCAAISEALAKQSHDGEQVNGAGIAGILESMKDCGFPMLDLMAPTQLLEAKKDSDGSRGKALRFAGTVIDIRKIHGLFEGNIMTDAQAVVHFITSASTDGIVDGSRVTFRGVYLQEYDFTNVGGGQTRSLLVAGSFVIPANH